MLRWGGLWMLVGCLEPGYASKEEVKDDAGQDTLEEQEELDADEETPGSSDGSGPSDGGSGEGDAGNSSGGDSGEGDGSEGNTPATGSLSPDFLLFSFHNGYVNGSVGRISFASGENDSYGSFSVYLFDSMTEQYCAIDWIFDDSTTQPDVAYADGMLTESFYETEIGVWYGFVVLSPPQTRGACDELHTDWLPTLDAFLVDRPGFGYGPLTTDLEQSLVSEHAFNTELSEYAFSAIASTTVFGDGERMYLPLNVGFAYELDEQGMTEFDFASYGNLQGTEIPLGELPVSNGFYLGQYYFAVSLQH